MDGTLGKLEVMPVARDEVAAGLRDADDRPRGLELRGREAEVQVSLQVERHHLGIARVVEPQAASQGLWLSLLAMAKDLHTKPGSY